MSEGDRQSGQAAAGGAINLPQDVRARCDGQLDHVQIVAWAPFDLDDANQYARRYAVLTERHLLVLCDGPVRAIPVSTIEEANVIEGLGVDRLDIIAGGRRVAELRYTRHLRREMTRLHRKLQRRLPRKADDKSELPPEWLESVDRQTEAAEH